MNLTIKQSTTLTENSSSPNVVEALYQLTKPDPMTGLPSADAVLVGRIQVPAAYADAVSFLNTQFSADNSNNGSDFQVTVLNNNYYIRFADDEVVRVLTTKGILSEGEGLTIAEADGLPNGAGGQNSNFFKDNLTIRTFDEIKYFGRIMRGNFQIGSWFNGATNLESVNLTGMTGLNGYNAFQNCKNLEWFHGKGNLPKNTLNLEDLNSTYGGSIFAGCEKLYYIESLGNLNSIASSMFQSCVNLETVNLPYGATTVNNNAFNGCSSLTTIDVSNMTTVKAYAFCDCEKLEYYGGGDSPQGVLNLPMLVGELGEYAFKGNKKLTTVQNLGGITRLKYRVFQDCIALTDITFPSTLKYVEDKVFLNTPWYANQPQGAIIIGKSLYKIKFTVGTSYTIPNTVEYITKDALGDVTELEELTIPNSVTELNSLVSTVDGSTIPSSLTTIHLNANVTTIPDAFCSNFSSLQTCDIPASVTKISGSAFIGCNLLSINIPASVTSISDTSFQQNPNCTTIVVDANNTVYDSRNNCNAIINSSSNVLLKGCKNTVIPIGVTEIGNNAFDKCNGLSSISVPNGVTKIGNNAFQSCSDLTTISLPSTLKEVGTYGFSGTPFTSLIFPEGFEKLGTRAFQNGLSSCVVDFPTTLNYMGDNCLIRASFSRIIFRGSIHNITFGKDIFYSSGNCPVYVRDDEVDDWTDAITTNPSALSFLDASRLKPLSELPT